MADSSGGSKKGRSKRPPATTLESREKQLIAAAVNLAEKQILEGTASSQVLTHFLKLGTTREQLEQEKIRNDNLLTEAKIKGLESAGRIEELYEGAMNAMREYSGQPVVRADGD